MFARIYVIAFLIVVGAVVVGCPGPPVCDANLKRLPEAFNFSTNPLRQAIPDNPALAPNSAAIISRQVEGNHQNSELRVSMGGWTHTVFYTDARHPRDQYVKLHLDGAPSWGGNTSCGPIRWRSCVFPGAEGDGHTTIVDEVDGCAYSFWMLNKNLMVPDPEAGSASGIPLNDATGIFEPGEGLGSNAGGVAIYTSSVWPDECTSGFNHGFMFATGWHINNPSKISLPFYHTDGSGTHEDDLFQGMRVQLNPSYDISELPLYKRTVAQAVKTYGMIDGNSNGGNWGIYGVSKEGYINNPWTGVLPNPEDTSFTVVPIAQFRVLEPKWTDERIYPANNSCLTYYGGGYPDAPKLTSISPTSGRASGGEKMTLKGEKLTGTTKIRFAMTNATDIVVVNDNEVTCTVPPGTGKVQVTLITHGCSNLVEYTYKD